MRYRCFIFFLFFTLSNIAVSPQSQSAMLNNSETIIRKTIEFAHPGETGENKFWDFGELCIYDEEHIDEYIAQNDSITVEITPFCYNYYKNSGDTLYCIGYNTKNTKLKYLKPEIHKINGLQFGSAAISNIYGEGIYSNTLNLHVYGETAYSIDSYGSIVLPGDSVRYGAYRTLKRKHIGQILTPDTKIYDDIHSPNSSIYDRLKQDSLTWIIENYNWYIPDYKHSIIETTITYLLKDGKKTLHSTNSYYYPIYGQKKKTITINKSDTLRHVNLFTQENTLCNTGISEIGDDDIRLSCHQDNHNTLAIELMTDRNLDISIALASIGGIAFENVHLKTLEGHLIKTTFDLTDLQQGTYLLIVSYENKVVCKKIYMEDNLNE